MADERVQCPVCGELHGVAEEDRYLVCRYCETKMALHSTAAGHVIAAVEAGDLTNSLYEQTGYHKLWGQLQLLAEQQRAAGEEMERALEARPPRVDVVIGWASLVATLALLLAAALLENRVLAFWAGILLVVGRVASLVTHQLTERSLHEVRERYAPRLRDLGREISATEQRLDTIRAEIARLASSGPQPGP